jgi:hypothetical protein
MDRRQISIKVRPGVEESRSMEWVAKKIGIVRPLMKPEG